jgi:hypothetical protein
VKSGHKQTAAQDVFAAVVIIDFMGNAAGLALVVGRACSGSMVGVSLSGSDNADLDSPFVS